MDEVDFRSNCYVMAEGEDCDRLLKNQQQTQLPYSEGRRGLPTWLKRKISEPWTDGDELKSRVDTNANTIVFQKRITHRENICNVLAFFKDQK